MDPRLSIIDERLKEVKRIIAVSGCKGGIGKSVISCALALQLSKLGYKVGLLDLDFFSPSDHIILGAKLSFPEEEKGIVAPEVSGIKFMSIVYFIENKPAPFRGIDVSNAIIELLAITLWNKLDFLVIDMPPGIGDATLDTIRAIKRMGFLLISTQSKLSWESTKRMAKMLKEINVPIIGIIENMQKGSDSFIEKQAKLLGIRFLGSIEFDEKLESKLGNMKSFSQTKFSKQIGKIVPNIC
ncbi:MAG: ATP-binding protein [Candidatus Diapherotrites archaeon]|nr:ATP-binding protein [Candidatus Diapherotrites archaeon]